MPTGSRVLTITALLLLAPALNAAAAVPTRLAAEAPQTPAKAPVAPKSAPAADKSRQGGDTFLDATWITIPVMNGTGTTAGYNDDYDEVCPYSNSTSPDVVYTFVPSSTMSVDIDMLGSAYDTKIYVYCWNLDLVACNDDFYSDYTSRLENVPLQGQTQYYLVIDGYGGDFGDYLLNISEFEPCVIEVPAGADEEMEPPLHDDYVDLHNGGCNTDPDNPPFQPLQGYWFHGRSGWFLANGGNSRDTDWFTITMPGYGVLEITGDAEFATYMFELGPQDCNSVGVLQNVQIGPCQPATIVITGTPYSTVWFWVGPTTFAPPNGYVGYEYDYVLDISGGAVRTEQHTLSAIRELYR